MSPARAVSEAEFDAEVLTSDKPVLVDFWAAWCPPCRALGPIIDAVASEYADKLAVVKVNVDENPSMGARFQITTIPTVKVFRKGQIIKSISGALSKQALEAHLRDVLT
ncbi:thioredoxin [Mycobacterium sp. 141]|uniref:thioredoxin n=1 Tax=Mycobacterium sp. 141 TaxID=1120797 RepID=UPI0004774B87|nr:thioredoxin [Mycobacterium sp. 141]